MSHPARSEPSILQLVAVIALLIIPIQLASKANRIPKSPSCAQLSPIESSDLELGQESSPRVPPADSGQQRERLFLGSWEQERFGHRSLTILPEGKAKMVIEPSGAWTFAFGRRLEAQMYWAINGNRIVYGMTSGTPPQKYALAVKTWGDHWNEEITLLTESDLIITSDDGTVSYWKRSQPEPIKSPSSE